MTDISNTRTHSISIHQFVSLQAGLKLLLLGSVHGNEVCGTLRSAAITLECGQHEEDAAPQVAYQAILNTLAHLGMVRHVAPHPIDKHEAIRLYQVIDRLDPEDRLSQEWCSFQRIQRGELIACRHDGTELFADRDGWIVFPNPAAQVNQEWFYLAEESDRLSFDRAAN